MTRTADDAGNTMALWAKHGKRPGYHPLLYHLLDVAAVALALWDVSLDPRLRRWVAASLGLSEADARAWVAFLTGSHDIGKATIAFERQVPAACDRLDRAGFVGPASSPSHAPHGAVSARELR
ncbi:MAG TPA: CRISPR-associated endonuclease Cas3'', partial [Chloroflexota bacterium]|nr:CRISPR-associated endonuclease Cas3'' [Chloroflexota bacterium]